MFKKQKNSNLFIEINFAPQKRKKFLPSFEKIFLSSKDIFLYALSIVTFLAIFIEALFAENFLQKQQRKVEKLNMEISRLNTKIRILQNRLTQTNSRFKTFYIPKLKEKIFIYWYKQWYRKKVIPTIKEFQNLIKGAMPYIGVWVYPNSSAIGKTTVETSFLPKGVVEYKKISGNPFNNLRSLSYSTLPNIFLYVKGPKVDPKFGEILSKIRDNTIKANLLLEYTLLKYPLHKFSYSSVAVLIFPINLVETAKTEEILDRLKAYCNALIINKEARKSIYLNNRWHTSKVLEGICIKYAF